MWSMEFVLGVGLWFRHLTTPLQTCNKVEVYRESARSDECLHEGRSVVLRSLR